MLEHYREILQDLTDLASIKASLATIEGQLATVISNQERIVTALTDLQTADTNLQAVVAKVLADYATALTNAQGDPAAIESVVTDMNNMAAQLTAADPANVPAPSSGSSGTTASGTVPAAS